MEESFHNKKPARSVQSFRYVPAYDGQADGHKGTQRAAVG